MAKAFQVQGDRVADEGLYLGLGVADGHAALQIGYVGGTAQVPRFIRGISDFNLPRPAVVGLREYVPGNLIYANGHRFVPRYFHLDPREDRRAALGVAEPL